MEDAQNILEVRNLFVSFFDNKVLDDISFSVKKGEVLAVIGPNGAGKSVLFRALLGLINYEGNVEWQKGSKIGYVPQKLSIESDMPLTVKEFFLLKKKASHRVHIREALRLVGLEASNEILDKQVSVLSGGQLQRILIAWALIDEPNILLFDEPTAGIDVSGEETIYNLLHNLQESRDLTVMIISHDLNIVYKYANNVLCLNEKEICFGQPNSVLDPKSLAELYGGEARFHHHQHHGN